MQKRLGDNDLAMYFTYNESKSVVAERFIKTLKSKIYKKVTTSDTKSCLCYLYKLVDEYNNAYHRSIEKKPVDVDYSALTEKNKLSNKTPTFKVGDMVRITNYKNIFSKGYIKH